MKLHYSHFQQKKHGGAHRALCQASMNIAEPRHRCAAPTGLTSLETPSLLLIAMNVVPRWLLAYKVAAVVLALGFFAFRAPP